MTYVVDRPPLREPQIAMTADRTLEKSDRSLGTIASSVVDLSEYANAISRS